jgi:hypothetical protein
MMSRSKFLSLIAALVLSSSSFAENPHKLSVRVLNPFDTGAETHINWGPPAHHRPWLGDWAVDLWRDNQAPGVGYTCGRNVYVKLRAHEVAGGKEPEELRGRVVQEGYACRSQDYSQGGYMQKIALRARYGSTWYELGWVLYAHIDNMVYAVGDEFDPTNARIGTAFQGGTTGSCWGSCHIHMEFDNADGASCFNCLPPIDGIATGGTVGLLGGGLAGGHCFRGAPRVQYAREYWVVSGNATHDQFLQIARLAYPTRTTVGFSYDDAGVGDLDTRKVVVWGEEHDRDTLLQWYRQHYGGVSVEFRALPGTGSWSFGPYPTAPPLEHRGHPRVDYAREYWVVNSRAAESQFLSVVSKAFAGRKTVGFTYDDAGIGDLFSRRVVAWGSEFPQPTLIDWYDWYYRGATVTFQPGY